MRQAPPVIAVVDDDASLRRALHRLLRSAGFAVETFATAGEFLERAQQVRTACLILDIHLPGMTGFDLRQRLADSGVRVPIVFITAHDDVPTRERARAAMAVAYLRKPFDGQVLIDAIDKAIRGDPTVTKCT